MTSDRALIVRGDVGKLPKWAQEHIRTLERLVEEARSRLVELRPEGSNTYVDPYAEPPIPIGKDAHVRWEPADHQFFDVKYRDGQLHIYASDTILVEPQSSNVVRVGLRPR